MKLSKVKISSPISRPDPTPMPQVDLSRLFKSTSRSSTGQRAVMLCGWIGNRWSGVALAMCHRLSGLSTYGLKGQCEGDEHPTYAPLEHGPLYVTQVVCIL